MASYIRRLNEIQRQCAESSQVVEIAVNDKCQKCLYEDLVRSMAEGSIKEEDKDSEMAS